jgi:hypothetical protein
MMNFELILQLIDYLGKLDIKYLINIGWDTWHDVWPYDNLQRICREYD